MNPLYDDAMTNLVNGISAARDKRHATSRFDSEPAMPLNQGGGFAMYEFDLAGSTGQDITQAQGAFVSSAGYKLLYLREGSDAGGLVDIEIGGRIERMAPGDKIVGPFDGFRLIRSSASVTVGTARFLVVLDPRADYVENQAINRSGALSTVSAGQTANAINNNPTLVTQGISLAGAKGLRVIVSADATRTLSGAGTLRFHYWDTALARWVYNPELDVDMAFIAAATFRDVVLADRAVYVPAGRVFVECVSVTVSAGALTVLLETWG